MAGRYKNPLAAVINSEPDPSPGYSTRNKKRKASEIDSDPTTFQAPKSHESQKFSSTPGKTLVSGTGHKLTIHSRNLGKALKAILSENPRMQKAERASEVNRDTAQVSPSADEESPNTIIVAGGSGSPPSGSMSSPSRDTTPSSTTLAQLGDIHPFIQFIEQERGRGTLSQDVKAKAWKILRDWQTEYSAEQRRIRELRRKMREMNRPSGQSSPPPAGKPRRQEKLKTKENSVSGSPSAENSKAEKPTEVMEVQEENSGQVVTPVRVAARRDSSVIGPNGLTGSYWDISSNEMGRGSRRRTQRDSIM